MISHLRVLHTWYQKYVNWTWLMIDLSVDANLYQKGWAQMYECLHQLALFGPYLHEQCCSWKRQYCQSWNIAASTLTYALRTSLLNVPLGVRPCPCVILFWRHHGWNETRVTGWREYSSLLHTPSRRLWTRRISSQFWRFGKAKINADHRRFILALVHLNEGDGSQDKPLSKRLNG